MGNYEAMEIDLEHQGEVYDGDASLRISYDAKDNWYGVGFVDPPSDWGNMLGGYNLTGAKPSASGLKQTTG